MESLDDEGYALRMLHDLGAELQSVSYNYEDGTCVLTLADHQSVTMAAAAQYAKYHFPAVILVTVQAGGLRDVEFLYDEELNPPDWEALPMRDTDRVRYTLDEILQKPELHQTQEQSRDWAYHPVGKP